MKKLVFAAAAASFLTFGAVAGDENIAAAVAASDRDSSDVARDANRHPAKVLALLDVGPGDKVADLAGGTGYYTDMLSSIVGPEGVVHLVNVPYVINRFKNSFGPGGALEKRLENPRWHQNVRHHPMNLDELALDEQLDGAMLVLFYHDTVWQETDRAEMNKRIYDQLKPGASLIVIDHSAKDGHGLGDVETLHRIEAASVISELESAGFKLAKSATFLANADDARDYPFWQASERDTTDRFVLKFVK